MSHAPEQLEMWSVEAAPEKQATPARCALAIGSGEHVAEALGFHEHRPHTRGEIVAALVGLDAQDLSDSEIHRCLDGCVCAWVPRVAMGMRDAGLITESDIFPNIEMTDAALPDASSPHDDLAALALIPKRFRP